MYIFLGVLLLISFFYFIGRFWIAVLHLDSYKHPIVYGFLFYILPFFFISMVSTFLHLSWSFFSSAITGLNFLYILVIIYALSKKMIILEFNFKKFSMYIKENYMLIIMIAFCFLISALSAVTKNANMEWGYPTTDNMAYISRAVKAIGNPAITSAVTGWTFSYTPVDVAGLVAWWELFWAYWSWLTGINILIVVFSGIGLLTYTIILTTVDEAIYVLSGDRKNSKFFVFSILYIYLIGQNHHEMIKFILLPWFGNVFIAVWALPMFGILLFHAKKSRFILFLIPILGIFGNGFSPGMATLVGFTFPFFAWYLHKNKSGKNGKLDKAVIIGIFLMGISFFGVMAYLTVKQYGITTLDWGAVSWLSQAQGEISGGIFSLRKKLVLAILGLASFLFLKKGEKYKESDYLIIFLYSLYGMFLIYPLAELFSFLFSFSYRRFTEAVGLMVLIASFYYITKMLRKYITDGRKLFVVLLAFLLIMRPDGYLLMEKREFLDFSNLFNLKRVGTVAEEVGKYFNTIEGPKNVCFFPSRYFSYKDNIENFSDMGTALIGHDSEVFIGCSADGVKPNAPNYVVLGLNDIIDVEKVEQLFIENKAVVQKVVSDDQISAVIYKIETETMSDFFSTGEEYRRHCAEPDENGVCEGRLV